MSQADSSVLGSEGPGAGSGPRGYKKWFFTWNNPPDDDGSALIAFFEKSKAVRYAFQLEQGAEGTVHYQGGAIWKNQMRMQTFTNACKKIHLEKLGDESLMYGQKDDTRINGPWTFGMPEAPRKLLTGLEGIDPLHWWQDHIFMLLDEEPDSRSIWWFWDEAGNTGKTSTAKYLVDNYNCLYANGKAKDVLSAIADWVNPEEGDARPLDVIVYDLPRIGTVDYATIETFKNGLAFNGKYRSRMLRWPDVHVICFANFEPDVSSLSADRWNIYKIA